MLKITQKITYIENTILAFMNAPENIVHFDTCAISHTTIGILGAMSVLTNFNTTLNFKEQINVYNEKYFDLINQFEMSEFMFSDLFNFYYFLDNEITFDLEEQKKNYSFITDFSKVEKMTKLIFNEIDTIFLSNKHIEQLYKLAYFIALKYISSHEIHILDIKINASFENYNHFHENLANNILNNFKHDIELIYGDEIDSENFIQNTFMDIPDKYWFQFFNNNYNATEELNHPKMKLVLFIISKEKLTSFSNDFFQKYNYKLSSNQCSSFSLILLHFFLILLAER